MTIGLKNSLWNAVSGMQSSQAGLATVGHNLANADNEAYSRQKTSIGSRMPARLIAGSSINITGQGSQLMNVSRAQSTFLERQLLRDRTEKGFFDGRGQALQLLERIVDQGVGEIVASAHADGSEMGSARSELRDNGLSSLPFGPTFRAACCVGDFKGGVFSEETSPDFGFVIVVEMCVEAQEMQSGQAISGRTFA